MLRNYLFPYRFLVAAGNHHYLRARAKSTDRAASMPQLGYQSVKGSSFRRQARVQARLFGNHAQDCLSEGLTDLGHDLGRAKIVVFGV